MKIKRFVAPDTRQALRLVREELGPDAVVLSSRSSQEGAEVIVAIDYDEKSISNAAQATRPADDGAHAGSNDDGRASNERPPRFGSSAAGEPRVDQSMDEARRVQSPAVPRGNSEPTLRKPTAEPESRRAPAQIGQEREKIPSRSAGASPAPEAAGHAIRQTGASAGKEREKPRFRLPATSLSDDRGEPLEDLGGELRRLRATLEHQLRYLRKQDPDPVREEALSLLEQLGIGPGLAEGIATRIVREGYAPEDAWLAARDALSEQIAVTDDDIVHSGGIMALIGPTGVGKTTTIAKLAARFALRYGRKHVSLVTTDTHRIGAQEQLLTFGQTLGIEVEAASNRVELRQLLEHHRDKRLVLVDNAGFGQRDLRLAAQLSDLDSIPFLKTFLVISATAQSAGLDEVFSAFGRTKLHGCILSKLDEAVSLGPVIQTLAHYRLPLAYTCAGQRIPEDIQPASSEDLLARAEGLAQAGAPRFAPEDNYYSRRLVANGLA